MKVCIALGQKNPLKFARIILESVYNIACNSCSVQFQSRLVSVFQNDDYLKRVDSHLVPAMQAVANAIRNSIFCQVYPILFPFYQVETTHSDELLSKAYSRMNSPPRATLEDKIIALESTISPLPLMSMFGVNEQLSKCFEDSSGLLNLQNIEYSAHPLAPAVRMLQTLPLMPSPHEKLGVLINVLQCIVHALDWASKREKCTAQKSQSNIVTVELSDAEEKEENLLNRLLASAGGNIVQAERADNSLGETTPDEQNPNKNTIIDDPANPLCVTSFGAEDVVPLVSWVICISHVQGLHASFLFIESFLTQNELIGKEGYTLGLF